MTKTEALKIADGSVNKLARMLGISHASVSQWDDAEIPKLREYQIKELKQSAKADLEPEETTT